MHCCTGPKQHSNYALRSNWSFPFFRGPLSYTLPRVDSIACSFCLLFLLLRFVNSIASAFRSSRQAFDLPSFLAPPDPSSCTTNEPLKTTANVPILPPRHSQFDSNPFQHRRLTFWCLFGSCSTSTACLRPSYPSSHDVLTIDPRLESHGKTSSTCREKLFISLKRRAHSVLVKNGSWRWCCSCGRVRVAWVKNNLRQLAYSRAIERR